MHKQPRVNNNKTGLLEEIQRLIRASTDNRAKESLIVAFIQQTHLDEMTDKAAIIEAFFRFARMQQQREAQALTGSEKLNQQAARRYIAASLRRGFASDNGTELNAVLAKISPLNSQYLSKKQAVFQKIAAFAEKFNGVRAKYRLF